MTPVNEVSAANHEDPVKRSPTIPVQPRAYQIEMFEASMKQNIVVCMDTGSGKTQIAKLRIEAELQRSPNKLIWFLAPSVALSQQQHTYLTNQLPSYQLRILTGLDNVRFWSTQEIWDSILWNMDVVVSTPQVLLDAMSNGFLRMTRLSLLVFDEAHHCTRNGPMNKIMQSFYHPTKMLSGANGLPCILGLSASPITGGKRGDLEKLERNLNAICKTPTRHVDEYRQYVHQPVFVGLSYAEAPPSLTPILGILRRVNSALNINDDPYVRQLRQDGGQRNLDRLAAVLDSGVTPSIEQLRKLERRAIDLDCDLGAWACNHFVAECVSRLHRRSGFTTHTLSSQAVEYVDNVLSVVRLHLENAAIPHFPVEDVSVKASKLVEFLEHEHTPEIRCVIFVEKRSTAWALSQLISSHPSCQGKYIAEPFVGLSKVDHGFQLVDLVKMKDPSSLLADLRSGKVNVCVATQVMEEGVDIPAMNLVIRFDDSKNFRSFIQSRGRARHVYSKFVTMLQGGRDSDSYSSWKQLEREMKAKYADEERKLEEGEEEEEDGHREFEVESTGAKLTLHNARQRIEHFCATLPKIAYVDEPRPEFILCRVDVSVSARLILPNSVDKDLRETRGSSVWQTEKMAKKDAAFEAYLRLYRAGLINDHLLPVIEPDMEDPEIQKPETQGSMCLADARMDPWNDIASKWTTEAKLCALQLQISSPDQHFPSMLLIFPGTFDGSLDISLSWTRLSTLTARIRPLDQNLPSSFEPNIAQQVTHHLIKTIFARKMKNKDPQSGYPCLIVPADQVTSLEEWLNDPLLAIPESERSSLEAYLLRREKQIIPYFFRVHSKQDNKKGQTEETIGTTKASLTDASGLLTRLPTDDTTTEEHVNIEAMRLPRRVDFLHPLDTEQAHTAWELIPRSECCIENLPASFGRMMLFYPSISHILEIALVAQTAMDTTLKPIGFGDRDLIMTALSASAANESFNYQTIEFLGDSMLKFYTSLQLFAQFPKWPEGYITRSKSNIVSNARLCRAAMESGLDRFIHTEPFAGARWKVRTNDDILEETIPRAKRNISTKVPADVVEALIGAAYLEGVEDNSSERRCLACMRLFLPTPKMSWNSIKDNLTLCQRPSIAVDVALGHLAGLETLINYSFRNRQLAAEALTHPGAIGSFGSYQRLEFLGDSVLDHIVATRLFAPGSMGTSASNNHFAMHLIRTAIVNADFLAFLCLEAAIDVERFDVSTNASTKRSTTTLETTKKYLWQFLTTSGNSIVAAQQACVERQQQLREPIKKALEMEQKYPWSLLVRLHADKFFSDIIESIVGAIFIDSDGSFDACERFLEKLGLLRYLRRLTTEPDMVVMHPKERLGVVSGNAKLKYETAMETAKDGAPTYRGQVSVDGEVFGLADSGYSRFEVETRAAEMALARFR